MAPTTGNYRDQAQQIIRMLDLSQEHNPDYHLKVFARQAMTRGNYDEATTCCTQGLHVCEDLSEPFGIGVANMLLGAIHLHRGNHAQGDLDRAKDYFEHAFELFDHARKYPVYEGLALLALGWVLLDQWKRDRSIDQSRTIFTILSRASTKFEENGRSDLKSTARERLVEAQRIFKSRTRQQASGSARAGATTPQVATIKLTGVPIKGRIAAGLPISANDDVVDYVSLDHFSIDGESYCAYGIGSRRLAEVLMNMHSYHWAITPVHGTSMNRSNPPIENGDYVLLSSPRTSLPDPQDGDIVAAVIDGVDHEATLKRFVQHGKLRELKPESSNPKHQTYEVNSDVRIAAIAVAVLKRVDD